MEAENEIPEAPEGTWREWKASFSSFVASVAALASVRWEMARAEARQWSRSVLVRAGLILGAAALSLLALVFLMVGIVLLLQLWLGSLLAAVFACFGICVAASAALAFVALRGRLARPIFERTAGELRKDFEAWTGESE